ncbi:MAG: PhzF family phenazine biosynthesis protein [Pseudomonadota bacterium]
MGLQRLAAFANDGTGGNPAGVLITDTLPDEAEMQRIAAEVGYSETVFAAPTFDGFRTRYFAPEQEVPFCGHATIALGAALGAARGADNYRLILNDSDISVRAYREGDVWGAELTSPPSRHAPVTAQVREEAMALFGLTESAMSDALPVTRIHAGADHLAMPLKDRATLAAMQYDQDAGAVFMRREGLITIALFWEETPQTLHVRNAFAAGGVYEDPATGAAAAALTAWFRDGLNRSAPLDLRQGDDMGHPSRILTEALEGEGSPVRVRGMTRPLA